jgi:hypothetical protein
MPSANNPTVHYFRFFGSSNLGNTSTSSLETAAAPSSIARLAALQNALSNGVTSSNSWPTAATAFSPCACLCSWNRMLHGKPGGYKKSAHLADGKDIGINLAGGFYDAGGAATAYEALLQHMLDM